MRTTSSPARMSSPASAAPCARSCRGSSEPSSRPSPPRARTGRARPDRPARQPIRSVLQSTRSGTFRVIDGVPIMSTAVATETRYTPEDLLAMPDGKSYELVDGRLVERKMGAESSLVGRDFISRIDRFCKEQNLGNVWPADNGYQCFPPRPRAGPQARRLFRQEGPIARRRRRKAGSRSRPTWPSRSSRPTTRSKSSRRSWMTTGRPAFPWSG